MDDFSTQDTYLEQIYSLLLCTFSIPKASLNEISVRIQSVPGGKVSIPGGHSIGYSEQKIVYVHVSYSERFPR
jgi:hypothetical protein